MKKVIDSSVLRSEVLREYLSATQSNIVILPDQLAMEMFKGDGQTNIRRSLKILSEFPRQIVVLKSTNAIAKLHPQKAGLHRRFASDEQTAGFLKYCRVLYSDSWSQESATLDRQRKQFLANRRFKGLSSTVGTIRQAIHTLKSNFSEDELKALRRKTIIPGDFWIRFCDDVFDSTLISLKETFGSIPPKTDIAYSYAFRYAVCSFGRAIDWISEGGLETAPDSKLMNDYTDMAYAAYATFYDGLLAEDKKLNEIYTFAARMMRRVFLEASARFDASHDQIAHPL
jgi:hypothetical protein